jgi:hypothetical protein
MDELEPQYPQDLPVETVSEDAEILREIRAAENELPGIKDEFILNYSGNPDDFGILLTSAITLDEGHDNPDIEIWIQVLVNETNNEAGAAIQSFKYLRDTCATRLEACYKGHLGRVFFLECKQRAREIYYQAMVKKLARVFIGMIHRRKARKARYLQELEFKGCAATVIQKIFRGFAQRLAWSRAMRKIDTEEHDFHLHRGERERDHAQLRALTDSDTSTSSDDDGDWVPYTNENWMPRHTPSMYRHSNVQQQPSTASKGMP